MQKIAVIDFEYMLLGEPAESQPPYNKDFIRQALSHNMVKILLQVALDCCDYAKACEIAYCSGNLAGEDFAFQYLKLGETPQIFLKRLLNKMKFTEIPPCEIQLVDDSYSHLQIHFNGIKGCKGGRGKKPLYCRAMQGYFMGVFGCYSSSTNNCLKVFCGADEQRKQNAATARCLFDIQFMKPGEIENYSFNGCETAHNEDIAVKAFAE